MAVAADPALKLCEWAYDTEYRDLPSEVRAETVRLIYDQIGGMVATSVLPSCQPVVELVKTVSTGPCTVIGNPVRVSVLEAALANGTIGHGAEVDATGQQGTAHYAAAIVPAALTVAQYAIASGEQLCRAVALGSE